MKREDLRNKIIPTTIENTDGYENTLSKEFNTTDLIYLDSYDDQYDGKKTDMDRRISATDYSLMNNANIFDYYRTSTGKPTTLVWLRSSHDMFSEDSVYFNGNRDNNYSQIRNVGLCPSLHYHLPSDILAPSKLRFLKVQKNRDESKELEQFDIRKVKDLNRENNISYITNW